MRCSAPPRCSWPDRCCCWRQATSTRCGGATSGPAWWHRWWRARSRSCTSWRSSCPQSTLTRSVCWDAQFLPHHGFGHQVSFVWDGLNGFVTGTFTSSIQGALPGGLVASSMVLGGVGGVRRAAAPRDRGGRPVAPGTPNAVRSRLLAAADTGRLVRASLAVRFRADELLAHPTLDPPGGGGASIARSAGAGSPSDGPDRAGSPPAVRRGGRSGRRGVARRRAGGRLALRGGRLPADPGGDDGPRLRRPDRRCRGGRPLPCEAWPRSWCLG